MPQSAESKIVNQIPGQPPIPLSVLPGSIPEVLIRVPQWVGWTYRFAGKRWTKIPIDPATGGNASVTNPATWATFGRALARSDHPGMAGVGFVLTDTDPFVAIDLDHCRDPTTRVLTSFAARIVAEVDSYTEVSPSGTGLRIFVVGTMPQAGRRRADDDTKSGIEIYASARYLTATGHHLAGTPTTIEDRFQELLDLDHRFFAAPDPAAPQRRSPSGWSGESSSPTTPSTVPKVSDAVVLQHARDRYGDRVDRLIAGDLSDYGGDHSGADLGFLTMLARFTQDEGQLDRLVRHSGLCREKWTDRPDYRARTIAKALGSVRGFPSPGRFTSIPATPKAPATASPPAAGLVPHAGSGKSTAPPMAAPRPQRSGTHDRTCRACDTAFVTKDGQGRHLYCESCRDMERPRRPGGQTADLPVRTLDGPRSDWATTRLRVLERDHWRCRICAQPTRRTTRILPRSQGGKELDDNLFAACEECELSGLLIVANSFAAKRNAVRGSRKLRGS